VSQSGVVSSHNLLWDLFSQASIDFKIGGLYAMFFELTSASDCTGTSGAREEYKDWLANGNMVNGIDSYQHWRGASFSSSAIGCAIPNQVWNGEWSSSIMTLSSATGYDPSKVAHRAQVSGHEWSHVYGEENHPGDCNGWWWDCNIMKHTLQTYIEIWWTNHSKNEVWWRFHYNLGYCSPGESTPCD
jgi:hypothetical protein